MQNFIDRAINAVAPVYAAKRLHARAQLAVFDAMAPGVGQTSGSNGNGGSYGRWGRMASIRDAQADVMPTLLWDRAEARQLARFSPIAAGAIQNNLDRVVSTGLALVACPDQRVLGWSDAQALEWKQNVQAEFAMWADSVECDLTGQANFYALQELVLRSTLESGDCFTLMPDAPTASPLMPYRLRLQVLEADRIGNPYGQMETAEISGGIRAHPDTGRPLEAFIYDRHPGAAFVMSAEPFKGKWITFTGASGRRRLLQHFRRLRPGQMRGTPYILPVVEHLKKLARYTEAELTAAVVSAMFTVFIKTPTADLAPVFEGGTPDVASTGEIGMGHGAIVGLAPGEEPIFADPSRPNPNAAAFVDGIMTQIGMALGQPGAFLQKRHDASYTAARAAILDAAVYFRGVRNWLAQSFCQPAYEEVLAEAVTLGRIAAPGFFTDPLRRWAYTRAAWRGDSMGSINPKDEVAAAVSAIEARLTTRERAEWELFGTDFDATLARKASEEQRLAANKILPVPKAGAPAPSPANADTPAAP